MKNTSERRLEILEYLCERRRDTVAHLAAEFGVCERTMRNDILLLSCSYPIYTRQGNDGGVFVMGHFQPGMRCLTPRQAELLKTLSVGLDEEEKKIMQSLLDSFLPPGAKGGDENGRRS